MRQIFSSPRRRLGAASLGGLLLAALAASPPVRDQLQDEWRTKIELRAREYLGLAPALDPSIKIFALDDTSIAKLGVLDLDLPTWGDVFAALSKGRPRAIVVDKLFDGFFSSPDTARFVERVKALPTPVIPIAFVRPNAIPLRAELPLIEPAYRQETLSPALGDAPRGFAYGPRDELVEAFSFFGHAVNDGQHYARPFLGVNGGKILRHVGFAPFPTLPQVGDSLAQRDRVIPVDSRGRLHINLPSPRELQRRTMGFAPLVLDARAGYPIPVVKAGDIVVLMPSYSTGSADFHETPLGTLAGGFRLTAVMNSVLTDRWITPVDMPYGSAVLGWLAALLLSLRLQAGRLAVALTAAVLLTSCAGVATFLLCSWTYPWELTCVALLSSGVPLVVCRAWIASLEEQRKERELAMSKLVQETYLPSEDLDTGPIKVRAWHLAASECGGDLWYRVAVSPSRVYVVIGDVTGHGAPAALVTAMVYAALDCILKPSLRAARPLLQPGEVLTALSEVIHGGMKGTMHVVMTTFLFDADSGELSYSNAGMLPPLLFGPSGTTPPRLRLRANPVGYSKTEVFATATTTLPAGHVLTVCTDGLFEAPDPRGKTLSRSVFFARLREGVERRGLPSASKVVEASRELWEAQRRGAPLADDVTVVAVEMTMPKTLKGDAPLADSTV